MIFGLIRNPKKKLHQLTGFRTIYSVLNRIFVMQITRLSIVTMMTLLFLLPTGCRKDDSVSQPEQADAQLMRDFLSDDYFTSASEYYNPSPADPSAQTTTESRTKESMTTALKDYFAKNPKEVKKINQKYGYPVWAHAYNNTDEVGDFYFLPLAKTNKNQIEAILYTYKVHNTSSLGFKWLERKNLKKLKEKKDIKKNSSGKFTEINRLLATIQTAYFEQEMFGAIDCEFNEYFKKSSNLNTTVSARTCYYDIEVTKVSHCTRGGGFISCEVTTYIDGYIWCNGTSTGIHEEQAPPDDANGSGEIPYIHIDDSELAQCPCVNAIWKQIKAYTQTNNLGNSGFPVLRILDDFIEGPLRAEFGVTINSTGTTRATILPNTTYGSNLLLFNSRIEINKDLCGNSINIDPVSMTGTLIHELIHARIYDHLYNLGYFTNSVGAPSAMWSQFVQSNYPGIVIGETQHQIMAQAFVNDIAQALHDINGGVGDPSDYLYIAWEGLQDAFNDTQKAQFTFIPNFEHLKTNFNNNVKGRGTINYNGCN